MTSKHRNTVTTALAVAITAALVAAPAAWSASQGRVAKAITPQSATKEGAYDEFIVSFHKGARANAASFGRSLDAAGGSLGIRIATGDTVGAGARMIHTSRALDRAEQKLLLIELLKDPAVQAVEANVRLHRTGVAVPNDPRYGEQWHYKAGGINVEGAWGEGYDGTGVSVGVIDTGGLNHADLPTLSGGYDFITAVANANDGDGRDPDPSDPGDWGGGYNSSWHGTHVAGTIHARTNNGIGVAGVASGVSLEHLRVLGTTGGSLQDIADAIIWGSGGTVTGIPSRSTPLDIVNLSLGGSGACATVLQNAINQANTAGTIVVVAAGNSNGDVANFQPANCNGVVTVAGTGPGNTRYASTNMGEEVEVAAPAGSGVTPAANQVLSTLNTGTTVPAADSYAFYAGTSMAAPHVTATIALILEANPALTREQIVTILQNTGYATNGYVPNCATADRWCSYLIDATDAVAVAAGDLPLPPTPPGPPPPPPPTALENGVGANVPTLAAGQDVFYTIAVPADATQLIVTLASPTGSSSNDADLRVRFNTAPTATAFDCRSWNVGTAERCAWGDAPTPVIGPVQTGTYHIRVDGWTASTGYVVTATHNGTSGPGGEGPEDLVAGQVFSLKGHRTRVILKWTGGDDEVDIKRAGTTVASAVDNKGYHADTFTLNGTGTVTYQVCNAGTTECSNTITVNYSSRP